MVKPYNWGSNGFRFDLSRFLHNILSIYLYTLYLSFSPLIYYTHKVMASVKSVKVNMRAFIYFVFFILLCLIGVLYFLLPLKKQTSAQRKDYHHYQQLKKSLESLKKQNFVRTFVWQDVGFKLYLNSKKLFPAHSASLLVSSHELLDELAPILKSFGQKFLVAGYVDKSSLLGTFYSNHWELAASRSIKLVRYMIHKHHIKPEKFVVLSHASYGQKKFFKHPSSKKNRTQPQPLNRTQPNRIELTLINKP